MPRTARIDAPDLLHHVRVRGVEQRNIFLDDIDRNDLLRRLEYLCEAHGAVVVAWCLMENHFHLAIRTGHKPLSKTMSGLLTGYAMHFNRRHKRSGHLFQNRYKSTIVEEERYLLALVRYIHRNPIEAQIVRDIQGLKAYPWCGFGALMGEPVRPFQDVDFVLSQFARTRAAARKHLASFMVEKNARQDGKVFGGGGLIRSAGGIDKLKSMRESGGRWLSDERILGSSEFVERILGADQSANEMVPTGNEEVKWKQFLQVQDRLCEEYEVTVAELRGRGRKRSVSEVRRLLSYCGQRQLGLSAAQISRYLGVSGQSVLQSAAKAEEEWEDLGWLLEG